MASLLSHPEVIEDLLLQRLSRILAVATVPVVRLCEGKLGITLREWRVMASLRPGISMLCSELADYTLLDRARTSRAISTLVAKGLIQRQIVLSDQRKATVTLTEKGCSLYESFFPITAGLNLRLLQGLGEDVLQSLDFALTHIQDQANKFQNESGQPKANRRRSGKK